MFFDRISPQMNSSQYMDKQIMDLVASSSPIPPPAASNGNDFIDLAARHDSDHGSRTDEEVVPSYDFQSIRPSNPVSKSGLIPGTRNYSYSFEPAKVILEKDRHALDSTLMSEIDQTMKKHSDNLLHALEGVGARLTQLETRARNLENSVDDLKVSVGNNHGSLYGKVRQLENILREVQSGVQVIIDKQEILETQFQLAKAQVPPNPPTDALKSSHVEPVQPSPFLPAQPFQQPPHGSLPQSMLVLPPPPPSFVFSQPNLSPAPAQVQNQFPAPQIPPSQREPYFPQPGHGQNQEAPTQYQQYQLPSAQLPHPPPAVPPPPHQYPPHSQTQYPPPARPPQPHLSSLPMTAPQSQLGHHAEESPYLPSQTFQPNVRQPLSQTPTGLPPPSQQYNGAAPQIYKPPPPQRSSSGFSPGYGLPSGPSEPSYGGGPHYGNSSSVKSQQHLQGGGMVSGYPQLPTAQVLPRALPTASAVSSGSRSGSSGNRDSIDDVVDKVTSMGFSRDQVRATVRRLTENGQVVDLNIVLDKLMNDSDVQPPRGWLGR